MSNVTELKYRKNMKKTHVKSVSDLFGPVSGLLIPVQEIIKAFVTSFFLTFRLFWSSSSELQPISNRLLRYNISNNRFEHV